ncbi:hypothetical protein IFM89_018982 [Coptis chinensis]|uniref:Myb-like domain-containing protein n=1 Tax=Coptis chinensis TaxID=261450 RepID=A0A835I592_9MAGN|nr:hypothetical protein IFM89_018982 [Coptis chinensis]
MMLEVLSNSTLQHIQQQQQQMLLERDSTTSGDGEDHEIKAPKKRAETWIQDETRCLLSLRREMDRLFNTSKSNKHLWEQISSKMRDKGFDRSPTMCTDKWRNLLKEFKRLNIKKEEAGPGKLRIIKELEELLRERLKMAPCKTSKLDSFAHFSERARAASVMETRTAKSWLARASGRSTLNLESRLDHEGHPLAIAATDGVAASGVPPWNWRDTNGNAFGSLEDSNYLPSAVDQFEGENFRGLSARGEAVGIIERGGGAVFQSSITLGGGASLSSCLFLLDADQERPKLCAFRLNCSHGATQPNRQAGTGDNHENDQGNLTLRSWVAGKPRILVRSNNTVLNSPWWSVSVVCSSNGGLPDWRWVEWNLISVFGRADLRLVCVCVWGGTFAFFQSEKEVERITKSCGEGEVTFRRWSPEVGGIAQDTLKSKEVRLTFTGVPLHLRTKEIALTLTQVCGRCLEIDENSFNCCGKKVRVKAKVDELGADP